MWLRDLGVCGDCGVDTEAAKLEITRLWRDRWDGVEGASEAVMALMIERGARPARWPQHLWEADHITPVALGGGECGLEGLRTLCLPCHRSRTAELASIRAQERKKSREARED